MTHKGTLFVVSTPIGNLEDMSKRALRILGETKMLAAEDTRSAKRLISHFQLGAKTLISYFEGNEASRSGEIVNILQGGQDVALISEAGTPGVSDPGHRVIAAVVAADLPLIVVPGAVACVTALVGSALPTDRFLFLGFPPREKGARQSWVAELRGERATMVLYESPNRVGATLQDLCASFGESRRASLARELTKVYEEHIRGTLGELAARFEDEKPRGECSLVIEGAQEEVVPVIDIPMEIKKLLASGLGPKDAAQRLVVTTGKPRRQLYQLALSMQREREGDD